MPSALKKTSYVVLGLIALVIVINFGLSYWVSKKLPELLASEKKFPYNLAYKDLDLNLFTGSAALKEAYLAPKDSAEQKIKTGIYAHIDKIEINHLNLWALWRENKIKVKGINIVSPKVILHNSGKDYNAKDEAVKPLKQAITTNGLEIHKGNFTMLDSTGQTVLKAANINFSLNDIKVDSTTVKENIPVRYNGYNFDCDSLLFKPDNFYNITAGKFSCNDSSLTVQDFKMLPRQSRAQFNNMIPVERDQFTLQAGRIAIPENDWGFLNDTLYVHAPEVLLEKVNANIYRGKMVKDDFSIKKLYSEMLRSLNFDLKVEKLMLKNSTIEYEEQLTYSRPPASVTFSSFYATVHNVYSPINKDSMPNTVIDVQCRFMKAAPLKVNWAFNVMDTSDTFNITGHLQNIDSKNINPISRPLMNVTTTGTIKNVKFNFMGNRNDATGTFAIEYDDLKVKLYKKDGKEKNKFMSFIGNMLVKNDSRDKLKETHIKTERVKHKSFFNFLWRCVQDGLKQTLLPGIISGGSKEKD
ncbi:hypothetical protein [Flavobacterium sp. MK4S-17]|uniref:hypothetical protein n=1 Tax=Flavobacterium sp. MK4S-17 TaxID=2543737 RepID=UPI0013590566|nr:hypothetical protein [Flavobacterium sp. MK4S-17]